LPKLEKNPYLETLEVNSKFLALITKAIFLTVFSMKYGLKT